MASALSKPEEQMLSHVLINIPELHRQDLNTSVHCNIYRAPCTLRKVKDEAYTPQLISIGPVHFDQQKFYPMQNHKLRYFRFFCVRVSDGDVLRYKNYLETQEAAIRNCYAEKLPGITKEMFVEMLLLDSVFIMELFLRMESLRLNELSKDDCIVSQTWLRKSIQRDLLLLENQIPMFVLDHLYETVVPKNDRKYQCFVLLARNYFRCLDPYERRYSSCGGTEEQSNEVKLEDKHWNKPLHFTDLIRNFYLCESLRMKDNACNAQIRTATKLQEAGVSFEKVKKRHLLDIRFKKNPHLSYFLCLGCISKFKYVKARFQIPQLKVDHMTECVLRNLIALEQCHYAKEPYICNYVSLIDSLIHTKDDVELLVEKEVIVHELGSDKEVATLVNGLCKHVVTDSTCYKDVIDELNQHYQNIWYRSMAALRLVYFRDPWRASSTVVGIAVLVFTIFNFCRVVRVVF